MIARWPDRVPAGAVNDTPWYFADVLPTLAELAGTKAPAPVDGISVVPALLGKEQNTDRLLYWEQTSNGFDQAVRWKNWKAVRIGKKSPLELYNLATDPSETKNIAAENVALVEKIEQYLKTARIKSEDWPSEVSSN